MDQFRKEAVMKSAEMPRQIALVVGGLAVVGMVLSATGCTPTKENPSETTPSTNTSGSATPSSAPGPSPTNEAKPTLDPTGPNSFTPTVLAPQAPTALPGNVVTGQ